MSPELSRDIIRHANRAGLTAEDVLELFYLTEHLLGLCKNNEDRALITGEHVMNFWKESFDE